MNSVDQIITLVFCMGSVLGFVAGYFVCLVINK